MSYLKDKNILVTGGAGFVGSHLVEELIKKKHKIIVVDINFDKRSYLLTENLDKKINLIKLNLCDYKKLTSLVNKFKINFIFHLAAQSLVDIGYKDPKGTLENNIISTINILEILRVNKNINGVVIASSDKAYGDLKKEKYVETDPLFGDHPYEASKSACDLIGSTYYKTYQVPVVITRFGNIYGEGDLNFSRIIPGIMKSLIKDEILNIRSDGNYIRDYLYVKDVVNGYLTIADNFYKVKGEVFNFGSKETLSVLELIKLIEKNLDKKIKYNIINNAKNEIYYQSLDYSKISKTLKWKPKYSISLTAKKIFQWYKKIFL